MESTPTRVMFHFESLQMDELPGKLEKAGAEQTFDPNEGQNRLTKS